MSAALSAAVAAVHVGPSHGFSKQTVERITLLEGLGVAGDAHCGVTVQHLSRIRRDPSQPNLRQVHLLHLELLDALAAAGFPVAPGQLGENVTTRGLDLLALPVGARLGLGDAVVTVTGLRNPCRQIDDFRPGLLAQVVHRRGDGTTARLAGVMGVVSRGGDVGAGTAITVHLPPAPHLPLTTV